MAKSSEEKKPNKAKQKLESSARRSMYSEFWNDVYGQRLKVYHVNFVRGIFFGLGSAIGATVVIALLATVLSWLVGLPGVGEISQAIRDSIDAR